MFTIGREEAADQLEVSTRTVDRYVRKGLLRGKRQGKRVMIHSEDLTALLGAWGANGSIPPNETTSEIILNDASEKVSHGLDATIQSFFQDHLEKKDLLVQEMTYKIATLESQLSQSIPQEQYQKKMFALETSDVRNQAEVATLKDRLEDTSKKYEKERFLTTLLMGWVILLLLASGFLLYQALL
jgi:excisionase family DNA binding protein